MKSKENKTKESKLMTNQAYLSKFKTVSVRIPLEEMPKVQEQLADGQSISAWILGAIRDKLNGGDKG